jgi:hypothetical protein
MYNYRGLSRYNGREGSLVEWQRAQQLDYRDIAGDARTEEVEGALESLMDDGYFETVGMAPDGDLLLRLTDRAWGYDSDDESDQQPQFQQGGGQGRGRNRPRRRSGRGGGQRDGEQAPEPVEAAE